MNAHGRLGILLFSSVVLVSVANLHLPFSNMWKGNRLRIKTKDDTTREGGELITHSSPSFAVGTWKQKTSTSTRRGKKSVCELEVINDSDEQLLLCWVTDSGALKHYHPINDRSIRDKSVSNVHLEYTYIGDHFVCIRNVLPLPALLKDVTNEAFVCSYTPTTAQLRHTICISKTAKKRKMYSLRGSPVAAFDVSLTTSAVESEEDIIDSSGKFYNCRNMCGFKVFYEPDVFDCVPDFESVFTSDVSQLAHLLPAGACAKLQADTSIYINKALTYGTKSKPVVATGCCYHPLGGADWLKMNGLNVAKEGCVEVFCAESYLKSRDHWGTGGVLVHEFSHVYHNKHCVDGYDCEDIREAYNVAMRRGLYNAVQVHGPQGLADDGTTRITTKAYACTNCMEFFAELSVAYHWAADDSTEYNKWFPFNRAQLLRHDSDTVAVLEKYWRQFEVKD